MIEKDIMARYIASIVDIELEEFTLTALLQAPDSYWEIPASTTSKHHPPQSNGEGGLVRHVLAGLYFIKEFCTAYSATQDECDCCIAAMVLHDVGKAIGHPHDVVWASVLSPTNELTKTAINAVRFHMGKWSTDIGNKTFPEDFSRIEQIVHLADYAASRKRIRLSSLDYH